MKPANHPRAADTPRCPGVYAISRRIARQAFLFAAIYGALINIRSIAEEPTKPAAYAATITPNAGAAPDDVARWIEQLGHDAFTVRQSAASRLLAAGSSAREPLLAIVDAPDPETRAAARRLVALIDQTEFHRRLEAFAADTDGRQNLSLPGWDEYRKLVGADPPARALFVDMQRQEGALIAAAFGNPNRATGEVFESRLARIVQWPNAIVNRFPVPPLGSCAAMLFLTSLPDSDVSDSAAYQMDALLQRSPFLEALRPDNQQDALCRLVVGWMLHCPNKSEGFVRQRLSIIANASLSEALPLALRVVGREKPFDHVQPMTRAMAIAVVGQLGRREHVNRLEPLLDDASICMQQPMPGQRVATVQVRDAALIALLQLTRQNPAEYGVANFPPQMPKIVQLQMLYRDNDQLRTESIAKWRAWRAAQKSAIPKEKTTKEE